MSSTSTSYSTSPANEPSICIPRVFDNIEKKTIWGVFTQLFGRDSIDRIDVVFKEAPNGEKFKRVFVHFTAWPQTYEAQAVRRKLLENQEVKIVYDDPWFWKCTASRVEKPTARERPRVAPYVDFRSSEERQRGQEQPPVRVRDVDTRGSFETGARRLVLSEFVPQQVLRRPLQKKEAPSVPAVSDAAKVAVAEEAKDSK